MTSRSSRLDNFRALLHAHQLWIVVLAVLQYTFISIAFFPGKFSPDTLQQLRQALGRETFSDWQPVIMPLIWRAGIWLTGTKGSLLLLEVWLLVAACMVFALLILQRKYTRPGWAYLVMLLPSFPPITCIAGMLWKDQMMTYLILFGCALLFLARPRRRDILLTCLAMVLFVVAALVRANAIFSVILLLPLLWTVLIEQLGVGPWIASYSGRARINLRKLLVPFLVIVVFLGATVGVGAAIKAATKPVATHQIDQLLLDDIIFSASADEIAKLPVSQGFREELLRDQRSCGDRYVDNTIWTCSFERPLDPTGTGVRILPIIVRHHSEFMTAWLHAVPQNLPNYFWYRLDAYSQLLFYPRDFGIRMATDNRAKYTCYSDRVFSEVNNKRAMSTLSRAVDNFNINYVPLAICPALWLAIGIWLLVFLRRNRQLLPPRIRDFALYLNLSGVFYLLSLFPIVPANDYRYAYFTITCTALSLLLTVGAYARKARCEQLPRPPK